MTARIGFTGDLMYHLGFEVLDGEGQALRDLFTDDVVALCQGHDEMWGNLEGPVAESVDVFATYCAIDARRLALSQPRWRPRLFWPRHRLDVLRELKFKVLGIANNHSFDFETSSDTQDTVRLVRAEGFDAAGLDYQPVIRTVGGISFAIIATTSVLNGAEALGPVAFLELGAVARLRDAVATCRPHVDYVVLMTHWGKPYDDAPSSAIRACAHGLLDAGVDVVYGNHPHVVWPIEQPSPRQLICYSLGNFSQVLGCRASHPSYQQFSRSLHGGVLSIEFSTGKIATTFHPTRAADNFGEWLDATGLPLAYWFWRPADYARWQRSLLMSRPRFRATVTLDRV